MINFKICKMRILDLWVIVKVARIILPRRHIEARFVGTRFFNLIYAGIQSNPQPRTDGRLGEPRARCVLPEIKPSTSGLRVN